MKTTLILFFTIIGLVFQTNLSAQTDANSTDFIRKAKEITTDYSGFKVQLFTTTEQVDHAHSIFQRFGGITFEKTIDGYIYCIGDFKKNDLAASYLDKVIVGQYPNARVIEFKEGERLDMANTGDMPRMVYEVF